MTDWIEEIFGRVRSEETKNCNLLRLIAESAMKYGNNRKGRKLVSGDPRTVKKGEGMAAQEATAGRRKGLG